MTYKIKIRNIEHISDIKKVIVTVSYTITFYEKYIPVDSNVEKTEYVTYFEKVTLQPPGETFIPFEDIKPEILIAWIEESDLSKLKSKAYIDLHSKISGIKYKSFL